MGISKTARPTRRATVLPVMALVAVVALAASMLGMFTIEMPGFIQTRLSNTSNQQQAGTYLGVGVMGSLSALIVSACVAPPLIAALTVISQTGDVVRGGAALFVMSIGMGTPLLLVGASAGKLLPRAGAWMDTVKNLSRAIAVAAGIYGVVLLAGALLGSTNPLAPIPQLAEKQTHLDFKRFKTVADLEREVAAAAASGRGVMVDFYADWCVSCLEMEHKSFSQPEVQAALKDVVLLQADVTKNDDDDKALYVHFGIVGPPTIAFYGPDGKERRNFRVVGFMEPAKFADVIRQAVAPASSTTP